MIAGCGSSATLSPMPFLAGAFARVRETAARRSTAAGQLLTLLSYVSLPLLVGTVALHVVVGAMPVVFLVGVGRALQVVAAGAGEQ